MKLSKRLEAIASLIPDNVNMIDVGCDHALLDIYLVKNRQIIKILATDINEKPLEIAKKNIKKYNLETKIKTKLMKGIDNLPKEIDTIVIAGMGGILMSEILKSEKLVNVNTIILAPNNDFSIVRKSLIKLGYKIENEKIIYDYRKPYLIIKFQKGRSKKIDYFFGTLTNNNLETIAYYTNDLNTNIKILKNMPKKYFFKRIQLRRKIIKIKNFLNNK